MAVKGMKAAQTCLVVAFGGCSTNVQQRVEKKDEVSTDPSVGLLEGTMIEATIWNYQQELR